MKSVIIALVAIFLLNEPQVLIAKTNLTKQDTNISCKKPTQSSTKKAQNITNKITGVSVASLITLACGFAAIKKQTDHPEIEKNKKTTIYEPEQIKLPTSLPKKRTINYSAKAENPALKRVQNTYARMSDPLEGGEANYMKKTNKL
ncbi:MAG: hypothetical protein UR26_C0006G0045 [candidate division TM6 bacterium GW2011_GWF2_32_72]|nr:MAG: hypothetical protein UR26_C0006G0045 [candidate division TM6 bacterium GW2011_GWF2_32_72]